MAGLIHIHSVATMCSAFIERQVRSAMRAKGIEALPILPEGRMTTTPTTPRILEKFRDVKWHEFQEGERTVAVPVRRNSTQEQRLDSADVPRERYA